MKSWKWEHIADLVKSLSVNEKRYFALMQKEDAKGQHYMKLFDAINKQLSVKQINDKFSGTKINLSYEPMNPCWLQMIRIGQSEGCQNQLLNLKKNNAK